MKRTRKRAPRVIDVEPVEVETTAVVVRRPPAAETRSRAKRASQAVTRPVVDPTGRLDIAAYRLATEFLLPTFERRVGVPGLAELLTPWAEHLIAEHVPAKNIFKPPKPRRRLR